MILISVLLLAGCDLIWPQRYAAEVGYHRGDQLDWAVWGDFATLEECRSAAIAMYNQYFAQQRAHSWSCLLKNGKGGYTSRHR